MKKQRPEKIQSRHEFLAWYHVASLGQTLQSREARFLQANLNQAYNQRILQVGRLGSETRYVDPEITDRFILLDKRGPRGLPTFIQACAGSLPIETESIDTVILPHVLEFVADRHQVLRESERVLKPEGRLLILGLNPWCPLRLLALPQRSIRFWQSYLIQPQTLLDWLSLLKFDAELEAVFSQTPLKTCRRKDEAWSHLGQMLAMGYAIQAIKRNYTLIPLDSEWSRLRRLVGSRLVETPQLNPGLQRSQPKMLNLTQARLINHETPC